MNREKLLEKMLDKLMQNFKYQIENLKCCGNCKHPVDCRYFYGLGNQPNKVCKYWSYDGLTQEKRK